MQWTVFTIEQNRFYKRGLEYIIAFIFHPHTQFIPKLTQSDLHLVIREFVTVSIVDFANAKSMGKVNI